MNHYRLTAISILVAGEVELKFSLIGRPETFYWFAYEPKRHD